MIPFNRPHLTGKELGYLACAMNDRRLAGDGPQTRACSELIEHQTGVRKALLTTSATAALEMAGILADIGPGDEVIMPSFTFVSTANAFVLRGAIPVFVDVRPDTLNIDESLIESAITGRTKAIVPVHYAGVGCEMDEIMRIALRYGLKVIEDAAQAVLGRYKGRALGGIGDLGAFSFHETKNINCGEGGALLIREPALIERAEIIREKGTNRSRFFRGQVDRYTWVELGSSFLPSELNAAFLRAQLESAYEIVAERLASWRRYHELFANAEARGLLVRPRVPEHCEHNGHIYFIVVRSASARTALIDQLREAGIQATFHYIPLHSSPAGTRFGRASGALVQTDDLWQRLVRLPLWTGMTDEQQVSIAGHVSRILEAVA